MARILSCAVRESRRKPLAACVASMFALSAPTATLAATVTSCLDNGDPGTLRAVIAAAAEGGTVDFTGLDCTMTSSKITLSGSSIGILQKSLTIDGTGAASKLTIDASGLSRGGPVNSRVFSHYNSGGTLTIKDLNLDGGFVQHYTYPPVGGCILSPGNVSLDTVTVSHCATTSPSGYFTMGGAIFVQGDLTLTKSNITYGSATGGGARGGGVYVHGNLTLHNSQMSYDTAASSGSGLSKGGGAYVYGNMTVDGGVSIGYNGASADSGDALGGGIFVRGDVTMSDVTGKYFNLFAKNSASSVSGNAKGGAAYTLGNFTAGAHSEIIYSSASSTSGTASGGGLFAQGGLTLVASNVAHNTANGGLVSFGGGAYVRGNSSTSYTAVKYNRAYGPALGGGLMLKGATNTIASSTISNNTSDYNMGGIAAFGGGAGVTFELKNSTISSNHAAGVVGGMYADAASVKLWNSTIAFNTAGSSASGHHSPGAELSAFANAMGANLQSTLISNNSVGAYQLDLTTFPTTSSVTFNGGALAVAANNLVRATFVTNLPTDTKQGFCPHLGPLRDNGGLTFTHALMSHSVAIDAGNDSSLLALYDQRGSAAVNGTLSYTRFSGTSAIADIGAYEVQQNDIVFNTDFEDCPPLAF